MSSPTDISSSLSEFIRKERILKELYKEKNEPTKTFENGVKQNDEEIDSILQQMGRLLSPAGEEFDDKIYKHVKAETENKSIDEILNEARELISDTSPCEGTTFTCFSTDDLYTDCPETDFVIGDCEVKDYFGDDNANYCNDSGNSEEDVNTQVEDASKFLNIQGRKKGKWLKKESMKLKKELFKRHKNNSIIPDVASNAKMENEQKWRLREEQLIEENRQLKQNVTTLVSQQEFDSLKTKLNAANETIKNLKENLNKILLEYNKKEKKLVEEKNQLRYKLQNSPKMILPDAERLQEQMKDAQEANVKLKLDLEACKDNCVTLENLCSDLKKVIMDEQIADKVYANDNIPASVKQFLSSSSSSVINTLSNMFGCLSRSASRNRHAYIGQREIFTTNESATINDLTKSFNQNDFVKQLMKEKEQLKKENLDLNRQVKELEKIVRRRAHPNFSNVSEIIKNDESKMYQKENEIIRNLKKELLEKQHLIIDLKNQLVENKANHDQNLLSLQTKIVNVQEESIKMKEELDKKKTISVNHGAKCKRKGRSCDPPSTVTRNFIIELTAKEREIQQLNKQLDEVKRMNKKLMKDKENYYLSSKEQSADDIQLNKKYSIPCYAAGYNRPSNLRNDYDKDGSESTVTNGEVQDSELKCGNSFEKNEVIEIEGLENDDTKLLSSSRKKSNNNYEQITKKVDILESEHQNLQQIICDVLQLLTKSELSEKFIQNPSLGNEKTTPDLENLCKFVTALKTIANK